MNLYEQKSASTKQKITVITIEILLIYVSYYFMFGGGEAFLSILFGLDLLVNIPQRRAVILLFSIVTFLRMAFTMFYLMKRSLSWAEALTIPFAFALYYVGFAILILPNEAALGAWDWLAIALFIVGGYLNTASEYQRHVFKQLPKNKGKLYTGGLFAHAMHVNYFGDVLWVIAYTIVVGSFYGMAIPILLIGFFAFSNIPMLDEYLRGRYGDEFKAYEAKTKKLIPFVW